MRKLAVMFPGQGSQFIGMGNDIFNEFPYTLDYFKEASEILRVDLIQLCKNGPIEDLSKTVNAQPILLTLSYAEFQVFFKEFDLTPKFAAGHSLGEYSALTCAQAISFPDAIRLVRKRGELMENAISNNLTQMAAITNIEDFIVEDVINDFKNDGLKVFISNFNAPDQTVIAGEKNAMEKACNFFTEKGATAHILKVSGAFHTSFMQAMVKDFQDFLTTINIKQFQFPVISNLTAIPYNNPNEIKESLVKHLVSPVQWTQSMKFMQEQGIQIFVEIGAGNILKNLTSKNIKYATTFSVENKEDRLKLKEEIENERAHMPNFLGRAMGIAVATKNNNFNNDEYEKGVIIPYRKIKTLQQELEKEGKTPTLDQMKEALAMLKSVFETKQTPKNEQIERYNQLFEDTRTKHLFLDFTYPQ
jgi:[acyl-carrier-protein] S-malonyltransferase